ncbi:MAG: hypothetical protein WKF75_13025 [Singulisphaera sp.]
MRALLANGQSAAVFDPFHAIAYLGRLPEAHAWMAARGLWVAGLGMFLLARSWGFGAWGGGSRASYAPSVDSWSAGSSSRAPAWRSGSPGSSWRATGCSSLPALGRSVDWRWW